jgi:hypothetical protein
MSDNDQEFSELFNAVVESRLAQMNDADWHALTKRVRPPADTAADESNLPVTRRSAFADKCGQLADITATCGPNGFQGMGAAAAAFEPAQPQPQPEPVQQQGVFQVNRAQGGSSSDWAPVNERDRNTQKIADIRAQRGL